MAPWCSFRVALPHCDWPSVVATLTSLPHMDSATASAAIPLYGSSCLPLPGGISVHMVENAQELPSALQALRDSMQVKVFFIYTVDQMLWGTSSTLIDQYALKRLQAAEVHAGRIGCYRSGVAAGFWGMPEQGGPHAVGHQLMCGADQNMPPEAPAPTSAHTIPQVCLPGPIHSDRHPPPALHQLTLD